MSAVSVLLVHLRRRASDAGQCRSGKQYLEVSQALGAQDPGDISPCLAGRSRLEVLGCGHAPLPRQLHEAAVGEWITISNPKSLSTVGVRANA
jgi:hypothetical protein